MDDRAKKYQSIKNSVVDWLKKNEIGLRNRGLEITEENNNERIYRVDFYNGYTFGGFVIVRDYDFRPFEFVSFEVGDIIDGKSILPYFFHDNENSTVEEILLGIADGIEFLINYHPE
jgi:hypothetical protein